LSERATEPTDCPTSIVPGRRAPKLRGAPAVVAAVYDRRFLVAGSAGPALRPCGSSIPRCALTRPRGTILAGARPRSASRWKSRKAGKRALRYIPRLRRNHARQQLRLRHRESVVCAEEERRIIERRACKVRAGEITWPCPGLRRGSCRGPEGRERRPLRGH